MSPSITFEFCPKQLWVDAKRAAIAVLVFASVVGVAHCGSGCMPAESPTETAYTNEIVACAATAGYPGAYDHEADMRCRAAVDCKYLVGPCR